MKIDDAAVQRLLWEQKLLTKEQIESAVLLAPSLGKSFTDTLIYKNIIPEDTLGRVLAEAAGVGYVALKGKIIPADVLALLSEDSAIAHDILPIAKTETTLDLAMADPTDFEIINFVEKKTGLVVTPFFALREQIRGELAQYKKDINAEFESLLGHITSVETDPVKAAEDVPVIQMLDTILEYAAARAASDVHIEAQETNTLIRFRLDGILHDILILDKKVQAALVARIKYLANLKIDEHRLPQDGRFIFEPAGSRVSLRVSIIPTFYGENVVMRLLPESAKTRTLGELGFTPANIETIGHEITRTNGIILLTGPTGSGKTTTLYTILELLNKPEVKIVTIEDPIEYSVPRVSQTQVNSQTGLDFASGLRSILRHDPNIIMVGEIRDQETADISINAALTGHLVLSTLHTNDASSSIPRLLDLDVAPFLISATVRVVVAQRLVRQLCRACAAPLTLSSGQVNELARATGFSPAEMATKTFKRAVGCGVCADGYAGRFGIHEILIVDETLSELILSRPSHEKISASAATRGMYTMLQDGIAKAAAGLTTIEEVWREIGQTE